MSVVNLSMEKICLPRNSNAPRKTRQNDTARSTTCPSLLIKSVRQADFGGSIRVNNQPDSVAASQANHVPSLNPRWHSSNSNLP
ncbi:hypothetical protein AXG89_40040 [Burkholderia sp. PAMC 26561]|nr:hypothetical protein AXG89_40040 [Burkholderia sp. PAMC 26561]